MVDSFEPPPAIATDRAIERDLNLLHRSNRDIGTAEMNWTCWYQRIEAILLIRSFL